MNDNAALVWFDLDLRLADNPALQRAVAGGHAVIPAFIWTPEEESPWAPGAASRWWLHQSLADLQARLAVRGSKLVIRRGPSAGTLLELAAETGATAIFRNRRYEPALLARDQELARKLQAHGIALEVCPGNVVFEPGTILNAGAKPYQVFTAFWRACLAMPDPPVPPEAPAELRGPAKWPESAAISSLHLEPNVDWAAGIRDTWRPGEPAALAQLEGFLQSAVTIYPSARDRPDHTGTSRLSPHLHFGEISARQIWRAVRHATGDPAGNAWLRQIAWREFSYHLLFHFPQTTDQPLRPEFRSFPTRMDERQLRAWTRGETGYPLVDAGMRELWNTGWMHNRIRMVAASFLVKHLMIPWQEGAAWFWDTLVDADLANNTMGWQWTAGCGADAVPWFRIFNPVLQGEKFDPEGSYVRRWVPELALIPNPWIHKPWQAPARVLSAAGVELGKSYPMPVVDHGVARQRALAALSSMSGVPGSS